MRRTLPLLLLLLTGCVPGTYVPDGHTVASATQVFFLGDSLTDGLYNRVVPTDEEEDGEEEGDDAPDLLWSDLIQLNDDVRFPDATRHTLTAALPSVQSVYNVARGGAVASDMVGEQLPRMLELADGSGPAIVLVTIGGNDLNEQQRLGVGRSIGKAVARDLARVKAALDDATLFPEGGRLYATNLFDPTGPGINGAACFEPIFHGAIDGEVTAFNIAMHEEAVAGGWALLDTHGLFADRGYGDSDPGEVDAGATDPPHWFADCVHPNARGHHELRELFFGAITAEGGQG